LAELKTTQKTMSEEGKERKKAEMMAALMGNFESVSDCELLKLCAMCDFDVPGYRVSRRRKKNRSVLR
jgi:hypothetical protein